MGGNKKKSKQLGMPHGTASNRLRKNILFDLLCELDYNICYRCDQPISTVEDLSIDHTKPWLDSEEPIKLFFDLNNIAFSHFKCNSGAARRPHKLNLTKEERKEYYRKLNRGYKRKNYSKEKRRKQWLEKGY